jgi:hypothetical protein
MYQKPFEFKNLKPRTYLKKKIKSFHDFLENITNFEQMGYHYWLSLGAKIIRVYLKASSILV